MIHPGDVQLVQAIGKPPKNSPYDIEPLANCVVFACQGSFPLINSTSHYLRLYVVLGARPLPSCLGGGDLGE